MKTKHKITGSLTEIFAKGKKVNLSDTKYGDTFLYDGYGKVELYMNINGWKWEATEEGESKCTLEPWHIVSLHPHKQGFNVDGNIQVVPVNAGIAVEQSGIELDKLQDSGFWGEKRLLTCAKSWILWTMHEKIAAENQPTSYPCVVVWEVAETGRHIQYQYIYLTDFVKR